MKLNALLKTLGFLALAATPVVAGPSAPVKNPIAPAPVNDDLGITASLGYDSNYVWRGINYGQHWVRAGLNGALLLVGGAAEDGAGSTSLLWNVDYGSLAGDQDSFSPTLGPPLAGVVKTTNSFQRLQLGAAVSHDFGPASVSFGYSFIHNMGSLANGLGINQFGAPIGGGYGMNDIQQLTIGLVLRRERQVHHRCDRCHQHRPTRWSWLRPALQCWFHPGFPQPHRWRRHLRHQHCSLRRHRLDRTERWP
ncbi:hypothetical protein [Prosthecobacter sp.]|uniref:hypothetical protein n=1 Tax=Prosthecobacter sp. TaxID=1965333 RepID=UPI0037852D0E